MSPLRKFLHAAAPLAPVLFFLCFAYPGLGAYFTGDDLMNIQHMHGYFTKPFWRVVLDVFNPMTSSYRPMGGLFYRSLYAVAGFHPLPFRIACFALLTGNLLLAYRLLRMLTGSREAALVGTLILSYHAEMYGLYFNTGTVYDILCFTFVTLALTLYVGCRQNGGGLGWRVWAGLVALDVFALQSKEMAWMLPAFLLLYEGIWWGRRSFLAPCLVTGLLTLTPLFPRILGPTGLTSSPLYHLTLTPGYYLANCARYASLLLYTPGRFGVAVLLAMWAAMALAAALLRSRAMWFGLLFWMAAVVPVAVIPGRDAFVLYLPMLGLALYAGALAARAAAPLRPAWRVGLFLLLAAGLATAHSRMRSAADETLRVQSETHDLVTQLRRLHPRLVPRAQVLFVEEPFDDDWFLAFLLRLLYNDGGIWVDRSATRPHVRPYEYVFRYAGGKLEELPPRPAPCSPQVVSAGAVDDSSPVLCWSGDWGSERFPQAAEGTLTHASDAGATVTLRFRGTALEYVCTKAFNRGLAEMIIDGSSRGPLDLYSAETVWQAAFRFDGLAPGDHVALLRVLGRRNAAAGDSIVDVDAFRVW